MIRQSAARARFCATSSFLALLFPVAAYSQTSTAADASQSDIIVTATKRAENISKVPLSIAAFNQQNLDDRGVRNIQDIVNQTPGVDLSRVSSSASAANAQNRLVIRGIDSTAGSSTSAIYIDDTPVQARNASLNYDGSTIPYIFDVDRVEVLRGPQGTLFGASSEGGAVRFITPTPSLTRYSVYGRAEINTVDHGGTGYETGAALGGPIVKDQLGFRVSGYYRRDAGWIDRQNWENPADFEENANFTRTFVARGALRWEPTPWLNVSPSLHFQDIKGNSNSAMWISCPATTGSPYQPNLNPCPRGGADTSKGRYITYVPTDEPSHDRFYLPSLKAVGQWGNTSLTSVTSWYTRRVFNILDQTNSNARTYFGTGTLTANNYLFPVTPNAPYTTGTVYANINQRNFTQEVRLAGSALDDRLHFTLGGYYARSRVYSNIAITLANYPLLYQYRFGVPAPAAKYMVGDAIYAGNENTVEKDLAGFANVDFKLFDRLTLTAGGRYSHDTLHFAVTERGVSYASTGGISTVIGQQKSSPFLPKATIAFQATPQALYYVTYSEGYRTGGVNKTLPSTCTTEAAALGLSAATFSPDKTKNFEAGTKNRLFGGLLTYEASIYHIKWQNIQQQLRLNCAFSLVVNTGSATSKGFDLNVNLRPTPALSLGLALGYVKATYDQTIQPAAAPVTVDGQTIGATPWTLNANAEYHFLNAPHEPFFRAQFNFKTANKGLYLYQIPTSTTYDPTRLYPDDYKTLDLRAGLRFKQFTAVAYVQNALNYAGYISRVPIYAGSSLVRGTAVQPRTIGLQLFVRY